MEVLSSALRLDDLGTRWGLRLVELAARFDVPGACLGVLKLDADNGERSERCVVAAGVLNLDTGLECTVDSLFQIGSITKVWTATVIMRLVERGVADLDTPLSEYLPDLELPGDLAARANMRHLLTHISGLDGDVFTDTGRGDDCLQRYVDSLTEAAINHPLGATFSYCNAGYVLLGRIIEELTGSTWDAALRTELVQPLGLRQTFTLPEECMLSRFAVGHVGEDGVKPHVAPVWGLPRSVGPAGLITCTTGDLLSFAALHLTAGRTPTGRQLLSPATVSAMQEHQVDLPDPYTLGDSWGLGWIRYSWDGHQVVGHDGSTIGQDAYLRMVPELGLAVSVMMNGGESSAVADVVFKELFAELAGIDVPARIVPDPRAVVTDVDRYLGSYLRTSLETEVYRDGDRLMLRSTSTGPLAELDEHPVQEYQLLPVDDGATFAMRAPSSTEWKPVVFYQLADGQRYVHYSARANPKVSR
jgi:CubicO group peptidase (beta-lactamase class C family)